jgi:hypothetical protein
VLPFPLISYLELAGDTGKVVEGTGSCSDSRFIEGGLVVESRMVELLKGMAIIFCLYVIESRAASMI